MMAAGTTVLLVAAWIAGTAHKGRKQNREWFAPLLAGLLFGFAGTIWLSKFHLEGSVLHSDFIEYCTGVSAPYLLSPGVSSKRSALPMMIAREFYEHLGIFDALAAAALVSSAVIGTMVYLWARILAGRMAAAAAIASALALGPLTLISRHVTSYPAMSLCFVAGATAAAWGISSSRKLPMLAGGMGTGLSLLADPRGLLWAAPFLAGLLASALLRGTVRQRTIRLVLLLLPITISWFLGREVYVPNAMGLEEQADIRPMLYRFLGVGTYGSPPFLPPSRWVWGLESPLTAADTLGFLWNQSRIEVPDLLASRPEVVEGRRVARAYLWLTGASAAIAFWKLRRNTWRLAALVCTLAPFAAGLLGNMSLLENHARFYMQTLPGTALAMGIAWSTLAGRRREGRWRNGIQLALLWLVVFGAIPSPLGPAAGWQLRWKESDRFFNEVVGAYKQGRYDLDPDMRHCRRALQMNELDERPLTVTLYSWLEE
jgi:hypothetical protein